MGVIVRWKPFHNPYGIAPGNKLFPRYLQFIEHSLDDFVRKAQEKGEINDQRQS